MGMYYPRSLLPQHTRERYHPQSGIHSGFRSLVGIRVSIRVMLWVLGETLGVLIHQIIGKEGENLLDDTVLIVDQVMGSRIDLAPRSHLALGQEGSGTETKEIDSDLHHLLNQNGIVNLHRRLAWIMQRIIERGQGVLSLQDRLRTIDRIDLGMFLSNL